MSCSSVSVMYAMHAVSAESEVYACSDCDRSYEYEYMYV